ncbi:hypothetical protein [Cerasicoccus fimbriatus]|uniref:hypothetical protein n=1 Tax=Cerasicoccus fimbriatus TaxID=3014554 RepID=UPI0022B48AF6|nr:hypothetical protein [Cerasicoccus sp. TK19100]
MSFTTELQNPFGCRVVRVYSSRQSSFAIELSCGNLLMRDVRDPRRSSKGEFYARRWKSFDAAQAWLDQRKQQFQAPQSESQKNANNGGAVK